MHVQPYLYLDGRTEEAIEFYKKAAGATVDALTVQRQPRTAATRHGAAGL